MNRIILYTGIMIMSDCMELHCQSAVKLHKQLIYRYAIDRNIDCNQLRVRCDEPVVKLQCA